MFRKPQSLVRLSAASSLLRRKRNGLSSQPKKSLGFERLELRQLLAAELSVSVPDIPSVKSVIKADYPASLAAKQYTAPELNVTVDYELFDGVTAPALPAGWVQTSTNVNNWVTINNTSDTAPNHAFVADISVVSDSQLTSPSIAITAANGRVSFRNSYNTEQFFDGGVLELSINGGAFSDIVTAGGVFVGGGYTGVLSTGSGNPISGRQAWEGNSFGYITTTVDLPTSTFGQNVRLRWRFGTDSSVAGTGWRIDTIRLSDIPAPATIDFGDAPAPYPVTLAENGARHTVGSLFLGALVDAEADGVHSGTANADGADEDGVAFTSGIDPGQTESIVITASQNGGLLNAWVDWNADGDWADSGEQVFNNQTLNAGPNNLTIAVPLGAAIGQTFARFRVSTTASVGVTGLAANGEVEDYQLSVGQKRFVWTNRGSASSDTDRFNSTFGANASLARGVVDAVFASWERVVTNLNHSLFGGPGRIDISVSMSATGTGFGASAGANFQSGFPTSGNVTISRGNDTNGDGLGDGAGFFLDPTPLDFSEFQGTPTLGAFTPTALSGSPAFNASDLFTLVNAEITHSVGLFLSPARINNPISGTVTNTGIADFSEGGGIGTYYVFDGPSVTHLMTSNNGGAGGSSFPSLVHTAGKPGTGTNQPLAFNSATRGALQLVGNDDPGNAVYSFGQRTLVNDVLALLFKDAYGYQITLPQTFGTTYAIMDEANSNLIIRGGLSNSNDVINVSREGSDIVVSVNVGNDVAGTGPRGDAVDQGAFVSRFPAAGITTITINAGDGNDVISVAPQVNAAITVNGGTHTTGDSLSFDLAGVTGVNFVNNGNGTGSLTSSNRLPVTWTGIENVANPDSTPPTITGLFFANSAWTAAQIDAFDGGGQNAGNGLGLQATPGSAISNGGFNRIIVQFSEPVVGFGVGSFQLLGINTPNYSGVSSVGYESATNRGIINLSTPLNRDRLRIGVWDQVADAAGNLLDGDLAGGAGGNYDIQFTVLVGDGDLSGTVNGGDLTPFGASFNQSFPLGGYNRNVDWNSDGAVNGGDLGGFGANFNQSLPAGTPNVPSFGGSAVPAFASNKKLTGNIDAYFSKLADDKEDAKLLGDSLLF